MADLGERIHALVEWTAPPIDGYEITRGGSAPATPRWVAGLAAAVLVLVVGAFTFVFGVWQPGDPVAGETTVPVDVTDPVVEDDPVVTTTYGTDDEQPIRELTPVRVDCTTELEAFPCAGLIDGDPSTEWQAPDGGTGAVLYFMFDEPVTIHEIFFENLWDDERFARNHRIRTMEVGLDDLAQVTYVELPDSNREALRFQTRSIRTSVVIITITGTYPGVSVGDLEPFQELALADVMFFGRSADPDATEQLPLPTDRLIIGSMESASVPVLFTCASSPDRSGDVDRGSFPTPLLAVQDFLHSFDDEPRIAAAGYMELGQSDGSIIYGKPLDDSDPDGDYVTLIRVEQISGNEWAVTSWEASGC